MSLISLIEAVPTSVYLLALVAASAADVLVTRRNLKAGGTEKNLLPYVMMQKLGFWPTVVITKGIIIGIGVVGSFFSEGIEGYYITATLITLIAIGLSLKNSRDE